MRVLMKPECDSQRTIGKQAFNGSGRPRMSLHKSGDIIRKLVDMQRDFAHLANKMIGLQSLV
jgi:hypothetical protein